MLSVIACFGAGAFLGAYMLHLVPEVDHLLHEFWLDPSDIHYPVAQLIVGLGFFMLVFIEQGIHMLNHRVNGKDNESTEKASASDDIATIEAGKTAEDISKSDTNTDVFVPPSVEETTSSQGIPHVDSRVSISTVGSAADLVREAEEEEEQKGATNMSAMKAVVLFVALSSDCVFEGLSLGLQSSEPGVWNLVIAILSHEVVIAFMLGLELLKHYRPKQVFWLGFAYAMMNPVGIAIGTTIHAFVGGDDVFEVLAGVLQALCGGVFLYVTFIEILAREFVGNNCIVRTTAVFAGFIMMALLALVPTDHLVDDPDHAIEVTTEAVTTITQHLTSAMS